jgi:hypothetical protein
MHKRFRALGAAGLFSWYVLPDDGESNLHNADAIDLNKKRKHGVQIIYCRGIVVRLVFFSILKDRCFFSKKDVVYR